VEATHNFEKKSLQAVKTGKTTTSIVGGRWLEKREFADRRRGKEGQKSPSHDYASRERIKKLWLKPRNGQFF